MTDQLHQANFGFYKRYQEEADEKETDEEKREFLESKRMLARDHCVETASKVAHALKSMFTHQCCVDRRAYLQDYLVESEGMQVHPARAIVRAVRDGEWTLLLFGVELYFSFGQVLSLPVFLFFNFGLFSEFEHHYCFFPN